MHICRQSWSCTPTNMLTKVVLVTHLIMTVLLHKCSLYLQIAGNPGLAWISVGKVSLAGMQSAAGVRASSMTNH